MVKIHYLESMLAEPKKEMILLRLGYKKNVTVLSDEDREMIEKYIQQGMQLCHSRGAFGRFKIKEHQDPEVKIENGIDLKSASLSKLLEKSDEVVLMASTVGSEITQRIEQEVRHGNAALGVTLDSVASQTADAGLTYIVGLVNRMLQREGKRLTKHRYSPGYGDLDLSHQKMIFDALRLDKLGLGITEKFMLIPEKSVIAIAGVERTEEHESRDV